MAEVVHGACASRLTYEDSVQHVSLSTLLQTKPFTLTFTGSRTLSMDNLGHPAQISTSWSFDLQLRRVDSKGNPL